MRRRLLFLIICILIAGPVFSEGIMMVYPHEDRVIVLFDDHSWFYHSEIDWYDMVDFQKYNGENGLALLESDSFRSANGFVVLRGTLMNTTLEEKTLCVEYMLLDNEKALIRTVETCSKEVVEAGHLFSFELEIDIDNGDAKYIVLKALKTDRKIETGGDNHGN